MWLERPSLTEQQVLEWADAYYLQHGRYPTIYDGKVRADGGETWSSLDQALKNGHRGLPGGGSLAQLLGANRTVKRERVRNSLSLEQILEWADAHKRRTGAWPRISSGPIPEAPGKTWSRVNDFLNRSAEGSLPHSSLARLMQSARGAKLYHAPRTLTEAEILAWADLFYARNGRYPFACDGRMDAEIPESWSAINIALHKGRRGLPGGSSLADLLQSSRTVVRNHTRKKVTLEQIDAWAYAHHLRTGAWPNVRSGAIADAPGETWEKIDGFLRRGAGGALEKSSLTQYLDPVGAAFYRERRAPLTVEQIVAWAEEHRANTGSWPTSYSGDLPHAPWETWSNIAAALHRGHRSLPKSSSLAELFREHSDAYQKELLPPINLPHINSLVLSFYQREGRLPNLRDPVADVKTGDTWATLDHALRLGGRGLAGCGFRSLTQFLLARFPRSDFGQLICLRPRLTEKQILQWADAHHDATGRWPTQYSGDIAGAGSETWAAVNAALKNGNRGLPRAITLASILEERRGVQHQRHRPLDIETILAWADSHFHRSGTWPKKTDKSPIPEAKDTNWLQVDGALKRGCRGLPGGSTLARLLRERRGADHAANLPDLNLVELASWCRNYAARYGHRPAGIVGQPVDEAPGETWSAIDTAFLEGTRGLLFSGYVSLDDFMKKRMGPEARGRVSKGGRSNKGG